MRVVCNLMGESSLENEKRQLNENLLVSIPGSIASSGTFNESNLFKRMKPSCVVYLFFVSRLLMFDIDLFPIPRFDDTPSFSHVPGFKQQTSSFEKFKVRTT